MQLANLDVVTSWLADVRVGSGFFVTCRENTAMLAEADHVHRRLKMLRHRKLQEAQDTIMVLCCTMYICESSYVSHYLHMYKHSWISNASCVYIATASLLSLLSSVSSLLGASCNVRRDCSVLHLSPGPCWGGLVSTAVTEKEGWLSHVDVKALCVQSWTTE